MRYSVKSFKDMKVCLKELEKYIRHASHLETGKPFKQSGGLRSREILGNWLFCAVLSFEQKVDHLKICTDPQGSDGVIYDAVNKTHEYMEHILVSQKIKKTEHTETLILKQINKKRDKGGQAYASGKTLMVFLNRKGENWFPNKVAKKMPENLYFKSVWVFGLQGVINEEYNYNVIKLNKTSCPIWRIIINKNFDDWEIERIQ